MADQVARMTISREIREKIDSMINNQLEMRSSQNELKTSQAKFEANLSRLEATQTALTISLAEFKASIMTRPEIIGEIDKRVSNSAYLSDRANLERRLETLEREQNEQPQRTLTRAGTMFMIGGIIVSNLIAVAGVLVALLR